MTSESCCQAICDALGRVPSESAELTLLNFVSLLPLPIVLANAARPRSRTLISGRGHSEQYLIVANMPQAKRARPSFSPPRPGKSKASGDKSARKEVYGRAPRSVVDRPQSPRRRLNAESAHPPKQKTPSFLSDAEDDESVNEPSDTSPEPEQEHSPEPDHILVEITNDPDADAAISPPLLHRTMQEHWEDKRKTKISTDARKLMQVYVDTFVREAIVRSAYEKKGKRRP